MQTICTKSQMIMKQWNFAEAIDAVKSIRLMQKPGMQP